MCNNALNMYAKSTSFPQSTDQLEMFAAIFRVFESRIFAHKDTLDEGMAEKDLLAALLSSILNPLTFRGKGFELCKQTAILPFFA